MDAELATLRATASQDAEHGYRSRALGALAAARQLAERRNAIAAQRNAAAIGGAHSASGSVLQPIANATGMDAARLQLLVHLAIALLMEAIGIASLLLLKLTAPGADRARATRTRRSSPSHITNAPVQLQPDATATDRAVVLQPDAAAAGCVAAAQSDADAYARCRELVVDGAIRPSCRAVQAAMQCGQRRAQRFLHALYGEGVLVKNANGRGFRIQAQPV
jgi:protein-disulfide isomerase-like protein with CxxC motif